MFSRLTCTWGGSPRSWLVKNTSYGPSICMLGTHLSIPCCDAVRKPLRMHVVPYQLLTHGPQQDVARLPVAREPQRRIAQNDSRHLDWSRIDVRRTTRCIELFMVLPRSADESVSIWAHEGIHRGQSMCVRRRPPERYSSSHGVVIATTMVLARSSGEQSPEVDSVWLTSLV